jgi:hypothetical protein
MTSTNLRSDGETFWTSPTTWKMSAASHQYSYWSSRTSGSGLVRVQRNLAANYYEAHHQDYEGD